MILLTFKNKKKERKKGRKEDGGRTARKKRTECIEELIKKRENEKTEFTEED